MTVDVELVPALVQPLAALYLLDDGGAPGGLLEVGVVPDEYQAVPLHGGVGGQPGLFGDGGGGVRDLHTAAGLAGVFPVVERTLDTLAPHSTSHREVGPQVDTVGLHHVHRPGLPAVDGQVEAQGVHLPHLGPAQVAALEQDKPTVGITGRAPAEPLQSPGPVDGRRLELAGGEVAVADIRELEEKVSQAETGEELLTSLTLFIGQSQSQ